MPTSIAPVVWEKISDQPVATSMGPTDMLYVVIGGDSYRISGDSLFKSRTGNYSILVYASLSDAVIAIGSTTQATLEIPIGTTVAATLTIPANITLVITGTGLITVASGQTLTINGPIEAPLRQIFTGSGSVIVTRQTVNLFWFGAQALARVVADGAMTASGSTLTSATAAFTPAMVSWLVDVEGSGASTVDLHGMTARNNQVGTFTAYISATQMTVSFSAVATVSAKQVVFGPDDTASIQKTIAAGLSVYVPPGYFMDSGTTQLRSGQTIYGDGQGVSVIRMIGPTRNAATAARTFDIVDGTSNVTIHDLSVLGTDLNGLNCSDPSGGGRMYVVQIGGGATGLIQNLTFRDCEFGYIWGMGFRSNGDTDQAPGVASSVIDIKILNCNLHHIGDNCTNINSGGGLLVQGCRMYKSGNGIEFAGQRLRLLDNRITENRAGASIGGLGNPSLGQDILVRGNLVDRNGDLTSNVTGVGLQIGGNVVHAIIENNIIRENDYQGIGASDGQPDFASLSRDIVIRGNFIISNGKDGGSGGYGISVGTDGVVVESNDIFDDSATGYTQTTGIVVSGNGSKLLRNRLRGHSYDYAAAQCSNILLVNEQGDDVVILEYEPNGFSGTVDTSTTTATYKTGGTLFSTDWVGSVFKINAVPYLITAVAAPPTGGFTVSGLTVTRTSGPNFDTAWAGQYIKLGPSFYFPIASVGGASTLTITNPIGVSVPASGTWELKGSVSLTLNASAGNQTGVSSLLPPVFQRLHGDGFVTVDFSTAPIFDAARASTQRIVLTGNVTSSVLANGVDGQIFTFMIIQDSTPRTFAFPSNVKGATTIGTTAAGLNVQSFRKSGSNYYAVAPGVINQT